METLPIPTGRVRCFRVSPVIRTGRSMGKSTSKWPIMQWLHGRVPLTRWHKNLVLREWGGIVGPLLINGDVRYRISSMYIEFDNVDNPGDNTDPPTFDRDPASGAAYYASLASHPSRDYLRVPVIATQLASSDEVLYPHNNLLTYFAMSSGIVGVHGKPFSDAVNSLVFGGALVATPDVDDASQDIILSRFYWEDQDDQIPKLASGNLGLEWELTLG